MKTKILKSIKISKAFLPYIFLLSLFNLQYWQFPLLAIIFIICGFLLKIIIYSSAIEILKYKAIKLSPQQQIKIFSSNFIIISLLLSLIPIVINLIAGNLWASRGVALIIKAITIFVFPYLFVYQTGIQSIKKGIIFLKTNLQESRMLLIMALIPSLLHLLFPYIIGVLLPIYKSPIILFAIIGYIISFISTCITLVIFYSASMLLLEKYNT